MPLVPDFRLRRVLPHPKQGHSIASAVTCRRFSVFTTDELFNLFFLLNLMGMKNYGKPKMPIRGRSDGKTLSAELSGAERGG